MFTIQYKTVNGENKMQTLNSNNRFQLASHLARFKQPIIAVYEQATPITKAVRADLRNRSLNSLSRCAREFVSSPL